MDVLSLNQISNYEQLKTALNTELKSAAISFVRIGYLLKTARDTDLLKDTQYNDVNEFAAGEFGLDKSQVSRFMSINDRFSIGGYSEHLEDKYSEFGSSKLSLMLTLPDSINENLSPQYSKSDIQAIKEEYQAEQSISDLELMMEKPAEQPETENDEFLALIIHQMVEEHPEPAKVIKWGMDQGLPIDDEDVSDSYMRDGDSAYNIRISGKGRFLISCKASGVMITNMRTDENSPVTWEEFRNVLVEELSKRDWSEPVPEEKPKKKVEKSASTEGKSKKNGIKESKNEKKPEKEKVQEPENNGNTSVERISDNVSESTETDQEDKQEMDVQNEGLIQSQNEETIVTEAAGQETEGIEDLEKPSWAAELTPKWYGKFMFECRTQRMTVNAKLMTITDHSRLVNDVPPINQVYIRDMIKDLESCIEGLEHIEKCWEYYNEREEEE